MAKKDSGTSTVRCSFCGRSQRDAALFIPTIDGKGAICDNCIEQAHAMISQYIDTKPINGKGGKFDLEMKSVPKPKEIVDYLNQYVIGQEQAKNTCRLLYTITISVCFSLLMKTGWRLRKVM